MIRIIYIDTDTSSRLNRTLPSRERAVLQVMPDDHSKSVPPLPIPNRTVKRYCADDSAATSVKVGYRQACYSGLRPVENPPPARIVQDVFGADGGFFTFSFLHFYFPLSRKRYIIRASDLIVGCPTGSG